VIFLPPLLYSAAFFSSLRDLRANLRPITLLATGLVLATMCAVAVVAHSLVDGLTWEAAFVLGAVVSPTDPIAATSVARRLGVPRRVSTVIEGESLINDATALVAYRIAVGAAVGGSFSLWESGLEFLWNAAGGIAIGLAVAWVITEVRRRIEDAPVEITISLLTGYAAYIPAEQLDLSAVLAAVTAGIYMGWQAPHIASASMRLQGRPVWETLVFLLNATLFLLIGLQLPVILDDLGEMAAADLALWAAVVSLVVIGVRLAWVFGITMVIRTLDRRAVQLERRASWQQRLLVGWSGMRGAVSLAAALAIPLETDAGAPFPARDVIIFLTFAVIFATLVLQGLSLPWLVRRLGVQGDVEPEREELRARLTAAKAALDRLDALAGEEWTRDDTVERMRNLYAYRKRRFAARAGKVEDDGYEDRSVAYQQMVHSVIEAQREALVDLRDSGAISNDVMLALEHELDLEESRLEI